ncbi:unnamed protein product [Spodoptera littoralis]|uniref:Uncharacterized protein n=1 Tax=Spodoptera littoralis TaxID=7109 RepID=A0A9P0ICF9_SPOLI|nr:unnamed protein product [Spodoptera littoralis]CAH1645383.1 unnamed protein product [Spodoptera littoralis]
MQAALMLRSKSRERRKQRLKRGIKHDLPSNIATKLIAPFPRYPPASWCAAGRAAWAEAAALSVGGGCAGAGGAARRCSVLGDHPGARKGQTGKWHRNNRVRDASYGSSSESDGEADGAAGDTWGVARLLYAGLGTLALGLVVYFVGTGDKGFKTPALRLVGPSLIVAGLACCLLRILFCIFAKPCCRRRTIYKENRRLSGCGEGEEMPLAGSAGGAASTPRPATCPRCPAARRTSACADTAPPRCIHPHYIRSRRTRGQAHQMGCSRAGRMGHTTAACSGAGRGTARCRAPRGARRRTACPRRPARGRRRRRCRARWPEHQLAARPRATSPLPVDQTANSCLVLHSYAPNPQAIMVFAILPFLPRYSSDDVTISMRTATNIGYVIARDS